MVLCLISFTFLQAEENLESSATLVYLGMDCGSGGEVKFELNGDPDLYNYYWEHGPTDLCLTGLAAGTYTFVVVDFNGCEETYEIEIIDLSECEVVVDVQAGAAKCTYEINITIINPSTGLAYDTSIFNIEWDDDPEAGFYRVLNQYRNDSIYHFTVYANGVNGEVCCYTEDDILIEGDRESCGEPHNEDPNEGCPRIIVNEVNGIKDDLSPQYVELLVICEDNCGGTVDIRGAIVDDNNGELIQAGSLITVANQEAIGIDLGYLVFPYHENWEAVPNGSLILIYEKYAEGFPLEDPSDLNGDGIYVLSANNSEYLFGGTGTWNPLTLQMEYEGNLLLPSWEIINISPYADGIQTRKVDGTLDHAISIGESIYASGEVFDMHLHNENPIQTNCQLTGATYQAISNYTCFSSSANGSPGLANSLENEAFITNHRDCPPCNPCAPLPLAGTETATHAENALEVYPNPFNSNFNLSYYSTLEGEARVELFNSNSILVHRVLFQGSKGNNKIAIDSGESLAAGIYFLRFTFPNGEQLQKRLINIRN